MRQFTSHIPNHLLPNIYTHVADNKARKYHTPLHTEDDYLGEPESTGLSISNRNRQTSEHQPLARQLPL
jgi:hypothetical protein